MKSNLLHYTLNTGDTFDCSNKNFQKEALKLVKPIAQRARLEGQTRSRLPEPLDSFSAKVTCGNRACAYFDLYDGDNSLLTTNAVAWSGEGEEESWEGFENLYLKLSRDIGTISINSPPRKPDRLPWLATFVLPSVQQSWIADFEQCLAIALMSSSTQKKAKGFG